MGLESGHIVLALGNPAAGVAWRLDPLADALVHTATVTRLAWRPGQPAAAPLQLASGGEDHVVRITDICHDEEGE
jgi:hypothetical protein